MSMNTDIGPQDPYSIIYNRLMPLVESEIRNVQEVYINTVCDFCLRAAENFNHEGVIWTDSYKSDNHICKTCSLFAEQLPNTLGMERGPIGYKLSSFKSGFVAIPVDEKLPVELWIGGKYLERVNHDGGFKIVDCSGNLAKYELCERIGQYAVVTEISLRREMFLRHIRASDTQNLYLSNETGCIHLNGQHYQALKTALLDEGMTNKELLATIDTLNAYKNGRLPTTHADIQKLIPSLSDATRTALSNIIDPSSLIFILAGLKVGLLTDEVK